MNDVEKEYCIQVTKFKMSTHTLPHRHGLGRIFKVDLKIER